MIKIRPLLALAMLVLSQPLSAEENAQDSENVTTAYISDDLFIYMHAGAGTNYRILGTINAGSQIQLTGLNENDYQQIIDDRGRLTWVESKYLTDKPGLRFVVAELNAQLATSSSQDEQLSQVVDALEGKLKKTEQQNIQLNKQIAELTNVLSTTKAQLSSQDTTLQKEWFFNGAIVLVLGLILGLVIPKLGSRKRSSMESWK